jgi:hypothetical protein
MLRAQSLMNDLHIKALQADELENILNSHFTSENDLVVKICLNECLFSILN